MKWLQWARMDLATGLGGVEVHARSLARELSLKGVSSSFSNDPKFDSAESWDVIQTHGSSPLPVNVSLRLRSAPGGKRPVLVHTLHGSTLGRMIACKEPFWPGGYLAYLRELRGLIFSDIVVTVNPGLGIFKLAQRMGKTCVVCWNGWDSNSSAEQSSLPEKLLKSLSGAAPHWLFIGRGSDPMKGVDRIRKLLELHPELRLIAAPGEGFEGHPQVVPTGQLNSSQVHQLLASERVRGLLVPSRYEGLPLVVLEALGEGLPVVACEVGGLKFLDSNVQALDRIQATSDFEVVAALEKFVQAPEKADRSERRAVNRGILHSWSQVAEIYLKAVQDFEKAVERRDR